MVEISKEQLIFSRGEGGSLIPQEITLLGVEGDLSVKVIPLTRGKMQEIYQKATSDNAEEKIAADNDLIKHGLISPKLTNEEINDMKPQIAGAITQAILSVSLGITQEEVSEKTSEVIKNQEYMLSKK